VLCTGDAHRHDRAHALVERAQLLVELRLAQRQGAGGGAHLGVIVVGGAARRIHPGAVAGPGDELAGGGAFRRNGEAGEPRRSDRDAQHGGRAAQVAVARPAVVAQPSAEDREAGERHGHGKHQQAGNGDSAHGRHSGG
jgi:hypothetical protein